MDVDDVLVADASRRTTTLNAYVSGFGSTRRVVVYDNLVEDLGEDETVSVVAHELAHAKHQDVLVGSTLGAAGAALGVGLLGPAGASGAGPGRRGESRTLGTCRGSWCWSPSPGCSPARSRTGSAGRVETRADVDALRATEDPAAFVELQQQLARRSAADLTPPAWSHAVVRVAPDHAHENRPGGTDVPARARVNGRSRTR